MSEANILPNDYLRHIVQWRAERLAELTAPSGWLSLSGFGWLRAGANRIGSAADNDLVFQGGPAHLGVVTLDPEGRTRLRLRPGSPATIGGERLLEATLVDDSCADQPPTCVGFGSASFHIISREGRKALRVKSDAMVTRTNFAGLDYFPIDPAWRVIAEWLPFADPLKLELSKRLGTTSVVDVPGKAVFSLGETVHTLLPYRERPDGDLFFVLADQTSGKETYDKARFLYASSPVDNDLVLDFNKAHNPPSAFTTYANCPIAPPVNRLATQVTAGEMRYRGYIP